MSRLLQAAVCLVTTLLLMGAQVLHAAPQQVTSVEGITEYTLDNGLQVLLFPDSSKPTVTVNVTYRVGSRHEGRGEAGMAHLLEHMVFKGTPSYPNIWGALEDHGATFNGSTWVDRTNYYETLPSNDENIEFAIHMEADRMVNSDIAGEELAREMTVVRNEFEQGENSPSAVLSERIMSSAYLWHNYGKSTIGNRSDIERVPVENLKQFYKKYYQPDNATLIVAGDFDPAKVLALIEEEFGAIPRPDRQLEATYTEEPAQDGPRHVELRRVGDVAVAGAVYHIPAGAHEDFAAIEILEDTFTNQPAGRLYRQMVVPGMASNVSGVAFGWAEPGLIEFTAQVATGHDPRKTLDFMTDIVESAADKGITDEEVQRSRTRLLNQIKMALRSTGRIGVQLSEYIAQGDWRLFFLHRDRLEAVTADDVRRVAATYLLESNRTTGLFIPTTEPQRIAIPQTTDVQRVLENYSGSQQLESGEEFQPEITFIEQRIKRETLPSGIKVAFLPIKKRGNGAWLSMQLHYGSEQALNGKTTEESLLPSLLMRGTKKLSYQQLRDEIERLESNITVGGFGGRGGGGGGGLGSVPAWIQSDREHLIDAVKLLAEILKQPALDQQEFEIIKTRMVAMLEQSKTDPNMLGMTALRRGLSPWPKTSIHYVHTIEESIELMRNASLETLQQIHRDYFGADAIEVAVLGDFDVDMVRATLEEVFADWRAKQPYQRIAEPYLRPTGGELRIETPDKEMAMVAMGTTFAMRDDDQHYPALVLADYVLGQSAKSRLLNRLRHQEGLSYGAGSMMRASSQDARASFVGYGICAPQNAQQAIDAMREEIQRWLQDGITEEELSEAKKSYPLKFKNRLANEQYVLGELVEGLEIDRTLQYRADMLARMQQLSAADIRAALAQTFADAVMVELMAGDLARTTETTNGAAKDAAAVR